MALDIGDTERSAQFSEPGGTLCPVCMPVHVSISGPLNSNGCLSLGVSQDLWLPVSLQALFFTATVSQAEEENNIHLLKVRRIRDTEAGLMVKIFNNS